MLIGQGSFPCALPRGGRARGTAGSIHSRAQYAAMAGECGGGIGTGEAGVLLFLLAADVETVAPPRGVLGFALKALLVLLLADRALRTLAAVEIAGSEFGWVTTQIHIGFLLLGRAREQQGNSQ